MRLPELPETRLRLFLPRLLFSLLLIAGLWALVRFVWYPGHYFEMAGTLWLLFVITLFALLVGPVLTTLFYRRDKKGVAIDIAVLIAVELVAIGLAANALYDRRPAFLVFAVDRFEIVSPFEIDTTRIAYPELSAGGIETLVAARLPDDAALAEPIVEDILFAGGVDIDRRPYLWEPYQYSAREAAGRARPLSDLEPNDSEARLQRWLDQQGEPGFRFGYLPIRGLKADATVIVNEQGFPVAVLAIDPWLD